ncbi:MAG: flippase [Gemmatimonadetes bacterium]|nr:flippase [Gemmatimonadota bacterium]
MSREAAQEAARGTGLVLAGAFITQIAEYGYRFLLARGLGAEGFGTFSQARSVLLVLAVLASLGLAAGVKRFVAKLGEEGRGAEARALIRGGTRVIGASALAGGALLFLLARPLAALFDNPALVTPLRILAFALPAAVGLEYVTRLGEAFRSYRSAVVARQILDPVLRLVGAVVALALGLGLPAVMGVYAGAALIALIVAGWLVVRLPRYRALDRAAAPSQLSALMRFSLPLMFGGVLFDFAERVDILMIGLYRPEAQVGIYAVGSSLARALLILVSSTMPVVGTLAAEAVGRNSPADIASLHRTTSRWMLLFTTPIAAGLLLYAEPALRLLFGAEYVGAAFTLRVLAVAYLGGCLAGPVGLLLNAMGKTHWTLGNMALRTGLNVALNAFLIPTYGIIGAAWGTLIALFVALALLLWQLSQLAPIGASYRGWHRPIGVLLVASGAAWGMSSWWARTGGLEYVGAAGGCAVLVVVFVIGVRIVPGCLEEGDLVLLEPLLRRFRR